MSVQEPVVETGLPSTAARIFAVNCFSISALNFIILIPPIYGKILIINSVATIEKICLIIASVQIFLYFIRPNIPKLQNTKTGKTSIKRKIVLLLQNLMIFTVGVVLYHVFTVLYGAPFVNSAMETFHFSLLITVLTVLPLCLNLGSDLSIWHRVFLGSGRTSMLELYLQRICAMTVLGSWIGALVIPLDWDRPWQVWPIPCSIGALIGNALANSSMGVWLLYTEESPKNKRRKKV
uniref:Phosphatidylinositol-glycan biosynthesis class F protein n=1 Tax=Strigamia maritima TaxID=126957 RepID=T1JFM6_STRMM